MKSERPTEQFTASGEMVKPMAIILTIVLMIGGISLSSFTTDKEEMTPLSKMDLPKLDDTLELHGITPVVHQRGSTRCHINWEVIYRDLTTSYSYTLKRPILDWGDCDGTDPNE
ncbi:MAG: hypothetical protein GY934_10160 [Gammaproteobacteria bacterium]|nr:hypothetical protein [Gammaproteobacteria bacterium]